jgi:type IV pilus assembly protein PilW
VLQQLQGYARIFDMQNNFLTVTYFLQNVADPNIAGRVIPALIRSENGENEEIARGVERLDFRYSVAQFRVDLDPDYRNSQWMTANQVQNIARCPPRPKNIPGFSGFDPTNNNPALTVDTEAGCGWRAVQAVEIGMLVTTVDNVSNADKTYTYSMEAGLAVKPAVGNLIRREFRAISPIKAWIQ